MQRIRQQVPLWATALWWGSLTTIGFLVVPMLFVYLPTPAQAGSMAARLFAAQTWVTVACTVLLLLVSRGRDLEAEPKPLSPALLAIIAGLLLALLQEFAVAPRIVMRENLALWHRLGTAMYFMQWVCATWALWKLGASREGTPSTSAEPTV
jgi:hypothetical protein